MGYTIIIITEGLGIINYMLSNDFLEKKKVIKNH